MTPPPRRPSEYLVPGRTPTIPGRTDLLTGPTPAPPASAPDFRTLSAEALAMEQMFLEALAAQEHRLMARVAQRAGAEVSAEMTMWRSRAKRNRAFAITLGTALGFATTLFAAAWQTISAYRSETTQEAASAAVEAVAPAVAAPVAPLAERVQQNEERLDAVDRRLGGLERGMGRVLELLEPPTEVRVPRERRR